MSLDETEAAVAAAAMQGTRGVGEHVRVAALHAKLIGRVLDVGGTRKPWSEMPIAARVGLALLVRLHNDMRCAVLAALRFYPLQAAALIASAFEVTFALAYVIGSDSRARAWAEHSDLSARPPGFKSVKGLIREVLRSESSNDLESRVAKEYAVYSQLCAPKHANPAIQRSFGIRLTTDDQIEIATGPDLHEDSTRISWFALDTGVRLAGNAVYSFSTHHIAGEDRQAIDAELAAARGEAEGLFQLAAKRGWARRADKPSARQEGSSS